MLALNGEVRVQCSRAPDAHVSAHSRKQLRPAAVDLLGTDASLSASGRRQGGRGAGGRQSLVRPRTQPDVTMIVIGQQAPAIGKGPPARARAASSTGKSG